MTTNVKISTAYVHPGKKLRVRSVDPNDESRVYSDILVAPEDVVARGVEVPGLASDGLVKVLSIPDHYVHSGSKLIVEEVE